MSLTPSTMLPLGTAAPDFKLPDFDGKEYSLYQYSGAPAVVVAFICNHCPYVKHLKQHFSNLAKDYAAKGVAFVAVNANDVANYPDDSPEQMKRDAEQFGYTFPFLYDESQEVAKAFRAACTPDFYVFDNDLKLAYRGQYDDSRPGNDAPLTGADLARAIDAVLADEPVSHDQKPSMGCNIKWKPGNEPRYFK